jgi:TM2 domain-containing membrane protein YozV
LEKVWHIEDPDERISQQATRRIKKNETPPPTQKNPATAYTLSALLWGGGQLYNGHVGKAAAFFLFMMMVSGMCILGFFNRGTILQYVRAHTISISTGFLVIECALFFLLFFWAYNAGDAYHAAAKARTTPFRGVKSSIYPLLCSLLFPGWGQFLNGQPLKGSLFTGFAIPALFALVSMPVIVLGWPYFEASDARFVIEALFAVMLLYMMLIPFIWVLAGFDALKVSLDDIKKEPLLERLKYANNRRRTQGWIQGIFPHIRLTFALLLFLALLGIVAKYSFPKHFYLDELTKAQTHLRTQGMTIVPDLLGKMQVGLSRMGM